jgi:hypothetical protein
VTEAFKIMLNNPKVKAILVNIFGGIMKCDVIAQGIVTAARQVNLTVPLVVRLEGTNVDLGKKILADSGLPIISGNNMDDAASKVVKAALAVSGGAARPKSVAPKAGTGALRKTKAKARPKAKARKPRARTAAQARPKVKVKAKANVKTKAKAKAKAKARPARKAAAKRKTSAAGKPARTRAARKAVAKGKRK